MKTVAIFGGGVGGCTVAHELCQTGGYDITIYEKKNVIGGLARSSRDDDMCATEYCWRVFFLFYNNMFKVMKEIPSEKGTCYDNLTPYKHKNISDTEYKLKDKLIAANQIVKGVSSCSSRLDDLDELTWWDALGGTDRYNMMRDVGPWLGADRYKCSYKSVIDVGIEMQFIPNSKNISENMITTKPTSEALFNDWDRFLRNNNVKIRFGETLESVDVENGMVVGATVNGEEVRADYYILALPVEALDDIVQRNAALQRGDLTRIHKLRGMAYQIQLSFQVYFDRSISIGDDKNAFMMINSPWDLIVLQYDKIYDGDTPLCGRLDDVKGGWSVAVCTSYIKGVVFGKTFEQCTYDEMLVEIWAQLTMSEKLQESVLEYNGHHLDESMIVKWSPMWPTYSHNERTGLLETTEPKFTNNAGTYKLRPSYKTHLPNLYLATGYVREGINIFSMEAACMSGRYVAYDICKSKHAKPIVRGRPSLTAPLRAFDQMVYSLKLPNITVYTLVLLLLLIIYHLCKLIVRCASKKS